MEEVKVDCRRSGGAPRIGVVRGRGCQGVLLSGGIFNRLEVGRIVSQRTVEVATW